MKFGTGARREAPGSRRSDLAGFCGGGKSSTRTVRTTWPTAADWPKSAAATWKAPSSLSARRDVMRRGGPRVRAAHPRLTLSTALVAHSALNVSRGSLYLCADIGKLEGQGGAGGRDCSRRRGAV